MGKKITESKLSNMILAILIAVGLWLYVSTVVNDEGGSTNVNNMAVDVLGEEVLSSKGLMLDPESELTVDLNLTGSRTLLASMLSDPTQYFTATVDTSTIQMAGTYTLPVKIQLKNTITTGSVTVANKDDETVKVTVTKMQEKTLDIRGFFEGTMPEGYRSEGIEISPSTIKIIGPEEMVSQIAYARVTITGDGLTETFRGDVPFELIDYSEVAVSFNKVTAEVDHVAVVMPVVKTLEVPLTVDFTYGGGITEENMSQYVTYTVEPATIQLSGSESDIDHLVDSSIRLGVIDLATVDGERVYTMAVTPDTSLTNDSGISFATVTVTTRGLSTKTVDTSNIEIINIPDGLEATAITQSLAIKVRGPASALESVEGFQLRAVVDLQDQELHAGSQYTVAVKLYLDGDSKCGILTSDRGYSVVVGIE